jgi:16S rRNA (uracil1498-N3)-methyltransferase
MPPRRFFHPHLSAGTIGLSADESHHAATALRAREGDEVVLFDGAGREAAGRITRITRHTVHVEVGEIESFPFELSRRITLAVAPPKTQRQHYMIEKCTELGVAAIWPVLTERGVTRPTAAALDKWRRRAIEAAKQAQRHWLPAIEGPQAIDACLGRCGDFDAVAITDIGVANRSFHAMLAETPPGGSMLVLIGPEGGWTGPERDIARAAGARPVSVSPTVLRVETAAVAVCAAVALHSTA